VLRRLFRNAKKTCGAFHATQSPGVIVDLPLPHRSFLRFQAGSDLRFEDILINFASRGELKDGNRWALAKAGVIAFPFQVWETRCDENPEFA
jgi:hypothetical protein